MSDISAAIFLLLIGLGYAWFVTSDWQTGIARLGPIPRLYRARTPALFWIATVLNWLLIAACIALSIYAFAVGGKR